MKHIDAYEFTVTAINRRMRNHIDTSVHYLIAETYDLAYEDLRSRLAAGGWEIVDFVCRGIILLIVPSVKGDVGSDN